MSRDLSTVPKPPPESAEPYAVGPVVLHLRTGINFEVAEYLDSSDVWQPITFAWAVQQLRDRNGDSAFSLLRSPGSKVSRRAGEFSGMAIGSEIGVERSVHQIWWSDVVTVGRKERHAS